MRILHVVHTFDASRPGGTERYTRSVTTELARRHEVSVFTFRVDPAAPRIRLETSESEGVAVATVVRRTGHGLRDRLAAQRQIRDAFAAHLEALRPDVVHIQHLTGLSPDLVAVPGTLGIPALVTLHDFWFLCPRIHLVRRDGSVCTSGPRGGLACMAHCAPASDARGSSGPRAIPAPTDAAFVFRYLRSRAGMRAASALIAPSEFVRGVFAGEGVDPARIRVVPLGLEPPELRSRRAPERPLRFGFLGAISTLKGADWLFDVFERIAPAEATLDLHGPFDDDERPGFEARISAMPGVRVHGPYRPEDLGRILASLDVVVNVSRAMETFSFVAREALAHGVPVIGSRTGAMPEAVREGVDGYLVSNAEDLLERIRSLIEDPSEAARLGANAMANPHRSIGEHAASLEAIYRELTARPR